MKPKSLSLRRGCKRKNQPIPFPGRTSYNATTSSLALFVLCSNIFKFCMVCLVLLCYNNTNVAAWLSGSALVSINELVTLRRARLVLRWVTVCERVNHLCISPSHPGQLSLLPSAGPARTVNEYQPKCSDVLRLGQVWFIPLLDKRVAGR